MAFLAVDHSANHDDGLYTGEEMAMLHETGGLATGIDQVGVEIRADGEILSLTDEDDGSSVKTEGAGGEDTAALRLGRPASRLDQALGVEIELDGTRPASRLDQVLGVEIELDLDALSVEVGLQQEDSASFTTDETQETRRHENFGPQVAAGGEGERTGRRPPRPLATGATARPAVRHGIVASLGGPSSRHTAPAAVVKVAHRAVLNGSLPRRPRLRSLQRQVLTRATSGMRSVARSISLPVSPHSRRALEATGADRNRAQSMSRPTADLRDRKAHRPQGPSTTSPHDSDESTCDVTHASSSGAVSSAASSSCAADLAGAPSSITTSTCDFPPETNRQEVFRSYLETNPWDAARRGDYATLSYIVEHDDRHIWTQADAAGLVPLYHACASYSRRDTGHGCDVAFGKYGLESVRLLVRVWPPGTEFPRALLWQCERGAVHGDVLEALREANKLRGDGGCPHLEGVCRRGMKERERVRVDGVRDVVPVSFLEDLGDDGYVEDY